MAATTAFSVTAVTSASMSSTVATAGVSQSARSSSPLAGHRQVSRRAGQPFYSLRVRAGANDSVTDQVRKTADDVSHGAEEAVKQGEEFVSQATDSVENAVRDSESFFENAGIDAQTNANKVAAYGEEIVKGAAGESSASASEVGNKVSSAAESAGDKAGNVAGGLQEQARDDKNVAGNAAERGLPALHAQSREFNHDAARDEENQEEGPGSDLVPKDGVIWEGKE